MLYIESQSYITSRWKYNFEGYLLFPSTKTIEKPVLNNFCFLIVKIGSEIILFLGKKYWSHDGLELNEEGHWFKATLRFYFII